MHSCIVLLQDGGRRRKVSKSRVQRECITINQHGLWRESGPLMKRVCRRIQLPPRPLPQLNTLPPQTADAPPTLAKRPFKRTIKGAATAGAELLCDAGKFELSDGSRALTHTHFSQDLILESFFFSSYDNSRRKPKYSAPSSCNGVGVGTAWEALTFSINRDPTHLQ